jgi:hypothetical protein
MSSPQMVNTETVFWACGLGRRVNAEQLVEYCVYFAAAHVEVLWASAEARRQTPEERDMVAWLRCGQEGRAGEALGRWAERGFGGLAAGSSGVGDVCKLKAEGSDGGALLERMID